MRDPWRDRYGEYERGIPRNAKRLKILLSKRREKHGNVIRRQKEMRHALPRYQFVLMR